jgi:hypothetical protein
MIIIMIIIIKIIIKLFIIYVTIQQLQGQKANYTQALEGKTH